MRSMYFVSFYRPINLSTVRIVTVQCTSIVCLFIWLFVTVCVQLLIWHQILQASYFVVFYFALHAFWRERLSPHNPANKYIVEWMVNRPYQSIEYFFIIFIGSSCACCACQDSFRPRWSVKRSYTPWLPPWYLFNRVHISHLLGFQPYIVVRLL